MKELYKCEVYVPDCYRDGEKIVLFENYQEHLDTIIAYILESDVTGLSIRDEVGYYKRSDNEVVSMDTKVIYYYHTGVNLISDKIKEYIKTNMHQETVLIVEDGVAELS